MKTLRYILIGMAIVILLISGWFGHKWLNPCSSIEIIPIVRDTTKLDSLRRVSKAKTDTINNLKQKVIFYKKKYEESKEKIIVINDVNSDSIPAVFGRITNYYSK